MIHFACTSEDINNLAYALILKEFSRRQLAPALDSIVADAGRDGAAMARGRDGRAHPRPGGDADHDGQGVGGFRGPPGAPARALRAPGVSRQVQRRGRQFQRPSGSPHPEADWIECSRRFVEALDLVWNPLTTQIESHDFIAELVDLMVRIDTILLGFARDMWGYIALGYFAPAHGEGRSRLVGDAAQGQPDRLRELRGQPGNRDRAVSASGGQAAGLALAARSERQHGDACAGQRVRPSDGRARRRSSAGSIASSSTPSESPPTSRPRAHGKCWLRRCRP